MEYEGNEHLILEEYSNGHVGYQYAFLMAINHESLQEEECGTTRKEGQNCRVDSHD